MSRKDLRESELTDEDEKLAYLLEQAEEAMDRNDLEAFRQVLDAAGPRVKELVDAVHGLLRVRFASGTRARFANILATR